MAGVMLNHVESESPSVGIRDSGDSLVTLVTCLVRLGMALYGVRSCNSRVFNTTIAADKRDVSG